MTHINSQFARGSGCYTCDSCHRKTRATNRDAAFTGLCAECYELASFYNTLQDGGSVLPYAAAIMEHCANITKKGGTLDGDALDLLDAIKQGAAVAS